MSPDPAAAAEQRNTMADEGLSAPKSELSFPLKVRIFYFILNTLIRVATRRDGTINRKLLSLLDLRAPPDSTPDSNGIATYDHVVDPVRNLTIRHFSPNNVELPVLVYFHGGGFVSGSATDRIMDKYCRRMSSVIPAHIVSVEYRLAPEHRCPAPYIDGIDVLRWLDRAGPVANLSAVFLAGDSAGGNIAHHVAVTATRETFKSVRITGMIGIQPFFGGVEDTDSERRIPFVSPKHIEWAWRAFLPEGSSRDHEAANVFGLGSLGSGRSADWARFPETMVVIGDWDPFQDRQRWYCEGLRKAGVRVCQAEYRHAVHAFPMFEKLQGERLMKEVGEFVTRKCAEKLT